jgi:hypothetical protein
MNMFSNRWYTLDSSKKMNGLFTAREVLAQRRGHGKD